MESVLALSFIRKSPIFKHRRRKQSKDAVLAVSTPVSGGEYIGWAWVDCLFLCGCLAIPLIR